MNKVESTILFDIYGELLTDRQREIASYYFDEDFSYTEIAQVLSISRAAVQDSLKKTMKQLQRYEEVIQYVKKRELIIELLKKKEDDNLYEQIFSIL